MDESSGGGDTSSSSTPATEAPSVAKEDTSKMEVGEEEDDTRSTSPPPLVDSDDDMNDTMLAEEEEEEEPEEDLKAKALEYKEQGNVKYKAKDYYGALDCYNLAVQTDPENAAYYNNRAAAEMMLNLTKKSVVSCKKCLELDPGNVKAMIRLGKSQIKLGLANDALDTFKTALVIDPTNNTAIKEKREADLLFQRIKRARETLRESNFSHALALSQAALRQAPECRELLMIRVRGLIAAGDFDQAYSLTTKLMRDDQNDASLLYYRAKCLYLQENFPNAIRHLQQALQLDPDNRDAQVDIRKIKKLERLKSSGNDNFKRGRYADAVEDYTACIAVDPENKGFSSKLYANRAAAQQKLRKNEEALADCEKAIELNPEYGKAYLRRATCLRKLGGKENIERALHSYTEAERILGRTSEINQNVRETKLELKKAKRKDYYKILELSNRENSSVADIKKAYKKAALKWHPDRHASKGEEEQKKAEGAFKDVGEAYEVLSDPTKKEKYDAGQSLEEIEQGHPSFGGGHDPNEIFQMFFGGGMGGMGGHPMGGGGGGFRF